MGCNVLPQRVRNALSTKTAKLDHVALLLNVVTSLVLLLFADSAFSYCSSQYSVQDEAFGFGCSGQVNECNNDVQCYSPGTTFGFEYCHETCECCPSESLATLRILFLVILPLSGLYFISLLFLNCAYHVHKGGLFLRLFHIGVYIAALTDKAMIDYSTMIFIVLGINAVAIGFDWYSRIQNQNGYRQAATNDNNNNNNNNNANPVQLPSTENIRSNVKSTVTQKNNSYNDINVNVDQDAEFTQFLVSHKHQCFEIMLIDWTQVSIQVNKLKMSNRNEYDILMNQFKILKNDAKSFFQILKSMLNNNQNVNDNDTNHGNINGFRSEKNKYQSEGVIRKDEQLPAYDDDLPTYKETYQ